MPKNRCISCKYARQAGDTNRLDVVGCVVATNSGRLPSSFTGKRSHTGYWHTCYPGDLKYTGSFIHGVLVDSEESCNQWDESGYFINKE